MTINITSNQLFLEIIYRLQNSQNDEILNIKKIADKILNKKVYKLYNPIKDKYIYSLSPNDNTKGLSGRPRSLNIEQIKEIRTLKDAKFTNEEIAKKFKVSEKTIRNALK